MSLSLIAVDGSQASRRKEKSQIELRLLLLGRILKIRFKEVIHPQGGLSPWPKRPVVQSDKFFLWFSYLVGSQQTSALP